jgi:hypothetical protein
LMRSVLATPTMGLTCSWAGRPHWFYHHMGLGEPIGYSARLTMNNATLYQNQTNAFTRGVHIALMGDPTLRMHPVAPPSGLTALACSEETILTWIPSSEEVLGYHVYRAKDPLGPFSRLTRSLVEGATFTDANPSPTAKTYMVRAVKLESTPSGTYYNPSQGVFITTQGHSINPTLTLQATVGSDGLVLSWNSQAGMIYHILFKQSLSDPEWTQVGSIFSTGFNQCWTDSGGTLQRFYCVIGE